ncbi:epidermal growth factor-like protein 8 [Agrilus planipennis]|uniref:Epidermal growth factor-like protein 8 n=1 Tax=Agrilus planipennis TaxID=224129 RepID=A0A1W4XRK1_AGRPL|nr:epidermal growth factor-like protein 8 [Agrilus planipennis]
MLLSLLLVILREHVYQPAACHQYAISMLRCRSQADGVAMLVVATSFIFVVSIANVSAGRRELLSSLHLHHHHVQQQQQSLHHLQKASKESVGVQATSTTPTASTPATNAEDLEKNYYKSNIIASPIKHAGRHVCTTFKNVTTPVQTKLPYCKPIYKRYTQKCSDHHMCSGVKLVYETAYKNVITSKNTQHVFYYCCPGWGQGDYRGHGCTKPKCSQLCQNGGTCVKPDLCLCPKGFNGRFCEIDVDECKEQKPCDQICHNTPGSFQCQCRENFTLLADGQSCRKDADDGTSFEAKELEYGQLDKRIQKLEEVKFVLHKFCQ